MSLARRSYRVDMTYANVRSIDNTKNSGIDLLCQRVINVGVTRLCRYTCGVGRDNVYPLYHQKIHQSAKL